MCEAKSLSDSEGDDNNLDGYFLIIKGIYPLKKKVEKFHTSSPIRCRRNLYDLYGKLSRNDLNACDRACKNVFDALGWRSECVLEERILTATDSDSNRIFLGCPALDDIRDKSSLRKYLKHCMFQENALGIFDNQRIFYNAIFSYYKLLSTSTEAGILTYDGSINTFSPHAFCLPYVRNRNFLLYNEAESTLHDESHILVKLAVNSNRQKSRMHRYILQINGEDSWLNLLKTFLASKRLSSHDVLIQKYIHSPLLLLGSKFILKTFITIIPRHDYREGLIALFHPGIVYRSTVSYRNDETEPGDYSGHLLKSCNGRNYSSNSTCWIPEQLNDFFNSHQLEYNVRRNWVCDVLYPELQAISSYVIAATSQMILQDSHNLHFYVLELEYLLDKEKKPWLIGASSVDSTNFDCLQGTLAGRLIMPYLMEEALLSSLEVMFCSRDTQGFKAAQLQSLYTMIPIYDTIDPEVQKNLLNFTL